MNILQKFMVNMLKDKKIVYMMIVVQQVDTSIVQKQAKKIEMKD